MQYAFTFPGFKYGVADVDEFFVFDDRRQKHETSPVSDQTLTKETIKDCVTVAATKPLSFACVCFMVRVLFRASFEKSTVWHTTAAIPKVRSTLRVSASL